MTYLERAARELKDLDIENRFKIAAVKAVVWALLAIAVAIEGRERE